MSERSLRIVVFGLSLSSSWGNGHATTWRALLKACAARGHRVTFLERDVPWYRAHRDFAQSSFCDLQFYDSLKSLDRFSRTVAEADAVILGSYVPDGIDVARWLFQQTRAATAFYDIDTPVTLSALRRGDCEYLSADEIPRFDLYLSFTGGPVLSDLELQFGARCALPLYCSVDEALYTPLDVPQRYDLSYLGTYSQDRQPTLDRLLLEPARRRPDLRFAVAGPQYPDSIDWPDNVERIEHVPPSEHPSFYSASRFTLNVTRADMVAVGYSPSVRLFEAAACGTAIISDRWAGLDTILQPGREILIADTTDDVLNHLDSTSGLPRDIGLAARRHVLATHTSAHRAAELESAIRTVLSGRSGKAPTHAPRRSEMRQFVLARDL